MYGHSYEEIMSRISWPDADFLAFEAGHETAIITIEDSLGKQFKVGCSGYIGFQLIGTWDEAIIEKASVLTDSALIHECVASINSRYGENWPESGSAGRNLRAWKNLVIEFIDGSRLEIVANKFFLENLPP